MAPLTKPGGARATEKDSGEGSRPSGEPMLRRILEGGSSMRMALEAWIMRAGPERRIENTLGCDEEEVTNAARSVARCWMANGMEDKARKLIETYGLDLEEIRRSSILPP